MNLILTLLLMAMVFVVVGALARDGARKLRHRQIKQRLAAMGLADGYFLSPVDQSLVGLDMAGDRIVVGRRDDIRTFSVAEVRSAELVQDGDDHHITRLRVKLAVADRDFELALFRWSNKAGLPFDHRLVREGRDFGERLCERILGSKAAARPAPSP